MPYNDGNRECDTVWWVGRQDREFTAEAVWPIEHQRGVSSDSYRAVGSSNTVDVAGVP
jgi:hypothetical protein